MCLSFQPVAFAAAFLLNPPFQLRLRLEQVGLAVVPAEGGLHPGLAQLIAFVKGKLHPSKWPACLVIMDRLPTTMTTKVLSPYNPTPMHATEINYFSPAAFFPFRIFILTNLLRAANRCSESTWPRG